MFLNDEVMWSKFLALYESVNESKFKESFELSAWYSTEFPALLKARMPIYLTREELITLSRWKMKRGKFRPGFLARIEKNSDEEVIDCTTRAFTALSSAATDESIYDAIKIISELFGVGCATATAVLSLTNDNVPFMSDELLIALPASKASAKYSLKHYKFIISKMHEVKDSFESSDWSFRTMEHALFAYHVKAAQENPSASKVSKRRSQGSKI